jgi:hypothetical protein
MFKQTEEYPIPILAKRKFIKKLKGLGLIVSEGHVYIDNQKEEHPKIENHYLPVAFIGMFSYKPVNLDEPFFEEIHKQILKAYKSVTER